MTWLNNVRIYKDAHETTAETKSPSYCQYKRYCQEYSHDLVKDQYLISYSHFDESIDHSKTQISQDMEVKHDQKI